jgi:hypothetical protein
LLSATDQSDFSTLTPVGLISPGLSLGFNPKDRNTSNQLAADQSDFQIPLQSPMQRFSVIWECYNTTKTIRLEFSFWRTTTYQFLYKRNSLNCATAEEAKYRGLLQKWQDFFFPFLQSFS